MKRMPPMIRDTSAQDRPLSPGPLGRSSYWKRWRLPLMAAAGLVLIAALVMAWRGGSRSFAAERVRIAEVKRGDLVRDIAADGRLIASNSPTLYAIAGGVVTLKVVAGDRVKQGQVLAEIDSPELRSKLAQEQATLAGLEAEANRAMLDATVTRANAQKAMDQAEIDRLAAQRDLERYERGFNGGAVPQIDVARAKDNLRKTEIAVEHAHKDSTLQGQGARLDARNKQLLATRQRAIVAEVQRQVDALMLRSPFDGQVGQVQAVQRSNVAINAPVMSIVDLSRFEVEIKVPESFARDLAIGMPAQLSNAGQTYPGQISAVSPEVVNGEVNARIRFSEKQPPGLRQSQRLSARILMDTRRNVLMVERGPFVEQSAGRYAYVMEGRSAVRRPVQLGVSSLGEVEIVSGLRVGDKVVVSGSDQFGDAQRVSIR